MSSRPKRDVSSQNSMSPRVSLTASPLTQLLRLGVTVMSSVRELEDVPLDARSHQIEASNKNEPSCLNSRLDVCMLRILRSVARL